MPNEPVLFVNSLENTGIGEFGSKLWRFLSLRSGFHATYIESETNWHAFISNWKKILSFQGRVIINLGFTSYGNSPVRNFLNFLLIGLAKRFTGGKLTLILHDSPAISEDNASGYRHFTLLKLGGSFATITIRSLRVLVFSLQIYHILREKYRFHQVHLMPFPCFSEAQQTDMPVRRTGREIAFHIGYIAPYKGLEILPHVKNLCEDIEFIITSNWHRVLSATAEGTRYFERLRSEFSSSGIKMSGYLNDSEIDRLFSNNRIVGVLPYIFTSGSSYSASYLVQRGVPLVCSDLPEFKFLREKGAGIVTVKREPDAFADAINEIFSDNTLYEKLVEENREYCIGNHISRTVDFLIGS